MSKTTHLLAATWGVTTRFLAAPTREAPARNDVDKPEAPGSELPLVQCPNACTLASASPHCTEAGSPGIWTLLRLLAENKKSTLCL